MRLSNSRPNDHDRIANWQDYREFLEADLSAHGLTHWGISSRFRHPELHYQRVLRLVEYLDTVRGPFARFVYSLFRLRLARLSLVSGISIPPGVFGRGLSIAHYGSIVVNDQARVGAFCRIRSATNVGIHLGAAPVLGSFIHLGPGAVVHGDISLGSGCVVGANSVVGSSAPANSILAGSPARIVSSRSSYSVMPRWIQREMHDSNLKLSA